MKDKYLAFDIEIAKILPEEETDWKAHKPLGITCAAAISSDGRQWLWRANKADEFRPTMSNSETSSIVFALDALVKEEYTILTWNGLGFDFDILMEESGAIECKRLALDHIDMMFHFFCSKGYPLGLDAASKGMGLPGKPEGMDGAKAPILWGQKEYTKVLSYVTQDVKNTLALALLVEDKGELNWTSRSGNAMSWPCQKWATVKEAKTLPEPDTSWMTDPWTRSKFYGWTGHEPKNAFDGTGVTQWDPDGGNHWIDGPDET